MDAGRLFLVYLEFCLGNLEGIKLFICRCGVGTDLQYLKQLDMFCFLERIICLYIYLPLEFISLGSGSQLGSVILPTRGHLTCLEAFLVVIICRRVLLAFSGWKPGMLVVSYNAQERPLFS